MRVSLLILFFTTLVTTLQAQKSVTINYILKATIGSSTWLTQLVINDSISYEWFNANQKFYTKKNNPLGTMYLPHAAIKNNKSKKIYYKLKDKNNYSQFDFRDNKWQITNDTTTIIGYKCVKALLFVDGQKLCESYFTTELNLIGNFLYDGLPGVVLKELCPQINRTYTATSITFYAKQIVNIEPKDIIK